MSGKRAAEMQGGGERYGMQGQENDTLPTEVPKRATAAQMAQRKIAQMKKPRGSRGNTPTAPNPQPFGRATDSPNPFSNVNNGTPSFAFGGPASQQNGAQSNPFQSGQSFGFGSNQANSTHSEGSPAPSFQFGASTATSNTANNNQNQQSSNGGGSGFGFSFNKQSTPSFGGFGQNEPQQNGAAASNSFTFGQSQANGASNPFQFNASKPADQTNPQPSASFGGFGQSQTNGSSSGFSFGQPKPSMSTSDQSHGVTSAPQDKPTSGFSFGKSAGLAEPERSASPFKFGGTPQPETQTSKPTPGTQPFGQLQQNGRSSPFSFGTSQPDTTAMSSGGLSTQAQQSSAENKAPIFAGIQASDTPKTSTSLFNFDPKPQPDQTPKPSSSLFSGGFGQSQTEQVPNNPFGAFGASTQKPAEKAADTDMMSPGNTPQKAPPAPPNQSTSNFGSATAESTVQADNGTTSSDKTPFGQSTSLFDRITPKSPPKNLFASASAQKPAPSLFNTTATDFAAQPKKPSDPPAPTGFLQKPTSLFQSTAPPTFTPQTSAIPHSESSVPETHPPAPTLKQQSLETISTPPTQPSTASTVSSKVNLPSAMFSGEKWKDFNELNEAMLAHLPMQNPTQDWSIIMKFYLQQASNISGKSDPLTVVFAATNEGSATGPSMTGDALFGSAVSSASKASANSFSAQTQKSTSKDDTSNQPSAITASSKKRPAEEDDNAVPPTTEKRGKFNDPVQYPKLPDNASKSAKLFESVLNKPQSQNNDADGGKAAMIASSGFTPATSSLFAAKSSNEQERSNEAGPTSGFKPVGFKPTGFMPSGSASQPNMNFMSGFGSKAQEQAKKDEEKKEMELEDKAFDDDYDSEVETEGAFRKRFREKRKKEKEEELKSKGLAVGEPSLTTSGFSGFKPSAALGEKSEAASLFKFGNAAKSISETTSQAPSGAGKSLFERIEKPTESSSKPTNIFGHLDSTTGGGMFSGKKTTTNTTSPFGVSATPSDGVKIMSQTDTPTSAPKYTGLFGSKPTEGAPSTPGGKSIFASATSKPNGFQFGAHLAPPSASASRGTTPGMTTDGETSAADVSNAEDENEPSDQPTQEAAQEDMSKLMAEEREANEVLVELPIAKAMKFELGKKGEDADEKTQWMEKGKGPLYVLKSKETGRVRVLMKIPPLGKIVMNFEPVKGNEEMYKLAPNGKSLTAIFVDHLAPAAKDKGRVTPWMLQVKEGKDAQEVVRLLREAQPKQ